MACKYLWEHRYNTIVPCLPDSMEIIAWARIYPRMYTVYTTGYIVYTDSRALDWFILRWGMPENPVVSGVALG